MERDRHALDRDTERAPLLGLHDGHDLRQALERGDHVSRHRGRHNDGKVERCVRPAPRVTGDHASERGRDLFEQVSRPMQEEPLRRPAGLGGQSSEDLRLGRRSDARHPSKRTLVRGPAKLVGRREAERGCDLDHPLRRDAEHPAEAHELRTHVPPQLLELRDLPRLGELPEPRRDARSDPTQLLHPPPPRELQDRSGRVANRLGRTAVCPRRVRRCSREVEQPREGLQALGDRGVVELGAHLGSVPPADHDETSVLLVLRRGSCVDRGVDGRARRPSGATLRSGGGNVASSSDSKRRAAHATAHEKPSTSARGARDGRAPGPCHRRTAPCAPGARGRGTRADTSGLST